MYFELLVDERVDSSWNDAHLIFIEAQVLDAVGVVHDVLCLVDELCQWHLFILREIDS